VLRLITSDLFCIASRLKNIDVNYHLFYNLDSCGWEVHSSLFPRISTLQFRVPFEELDERTIEHAFRTRVENSFELEEEIKEHNEMLEQNAQAEMKRQIDKLGDMFEFAYSTSQEIEFNSRFCKWY